MYFIAIIFGVLGMLISWRLKSKFKTYSEQSLQSNLSGEEIANRMLADHGISDVRVITVDGKLTDHYNPADKTVNLSADVFHGRNAAAAAAPTSAVASPSLALSARIVASPWMLTLTLLGTLPQTILPYRLHACPAGCLSTSLSRWGLRPPTASRLL
jgi:hypothetical protein